MNEVWELAVDSSDNDLASCLYALTHWRVTEGLNETDDQTPKQPDGGHMAKPPDASPGFHDKVMDVN